MPSATPVAIGDYPDVGIRVEYFESPYRHYTITTRPPCPIELDHAESVSVTSALGILNKAALPNWAAKVTREGCWELVRMDRSTRYLRRKLGDKYMEVYGAIAGDLPQHEACARYNISPREYLNFAACHDFRLPHNMGDFTQALKDFGLTHNQVTSRAADLGTDVHLIWQEWMEEQKIPDFSKYPKDRRPRIKALADFIRDHQPERVETEMVVGSAKHGFAGRLDTVVILRDGKGEGMVDLKNTKRVYPNSHFPQLAGYEIARRECGLAPTTRQGILRLDQNGAYELAWSDAKADDFLSILGAYKSQQKWSKRR